MPIVKALCAHTDRHRTQVKTSAIEMVDYRMPALENLYAHTNRHRVGVNISALKRLIKACQMLKTHTPVPTFSEIR